MSRVIGYYTRLNGVRGDLNGLPKWARSIFVASAIPGIILVALSIAALVVSIVALLLVTVPVYMVLRAITRTRGMEQAELVQPPDPLRQSIKVDAIVRNPEPQAPDEVNGE